MMLGETKSFPDTTLQCSLYVNPSYHTFLKSSLNEERIPWVIGKICLIQENPKS